MCLYYDAHITQCLVYCYQLLPEYMYQNTISYIFKQTLPFIKISFVGRFGLAMIG